MSTPPLFSVVIPTYNRAHLLGAALNSVLGQTVASYEIIVVDDGSSDNTSQVVAAYGDRVRYVYQRNGGPGAARNAGISRARGTYIAFLDSDDRWFPWTLEVYRQAIQEYGAPSLLTSSFLPFTRDDELDGLLPSDPNTVHYENYFMAADAGAFVSSGLSVIKRSALLDVGGFTTRKINAEDHDLTLRLGMHPGFVVISSPPLAAVRTHDGNVTRDAGKTVLGIQYLQRQEVKGRYPGGVRRKSSRRFIIAQHARGASMGLVDRGLTRNALTLYWSTLPWQIRFARWRYLFGFPFLCLTQRVIRPRRLVPALNRDLQPATEKIPQLF